MKRIILIIMIFISSAHADNINVTYTINTTLSRTTISPYIYGTNWHDNADYTIQRIGGNRCTAYNWENNWSNAGSDWYYENDQFFDSSITPAKGYTKGIDLFNSHNQAAIVTLQLAGYVSAPIFRQINLETEAAPSIYFYPVQFAKGAPFCSPPDNPDTNDGVVYMDEFVNFLVNRYGYAGQPNGVKFYCLDNEPDIWSDGSKGATHPEVHVADPCCLEYKDKSIALCTAVKTVDPNAQMLGPVSYGFAGYMSFQGASDWSSEGAEYPWFLSYYLDKMRIASNSAGKRLLDALDVHWYPEAQDGAGNRITSPVNTNAMYNARMQAPRTLWDTSYVGANGEISWINQWFSSYLPILPNLKNSIDTYYPDTNLAITEYAYGGENHWSGGIATADVLGIFGKYGVYIATYWGSGSYVDAAIKIYRNYDGEHSTFGDTEVYSAISNKVDSSIYASVFDADDNELHLIVINKNITDSITGTFNITSSQNFSSAAVWHFNNANSNITETTPVTTIVNNSFTYTILPVSVCHFVLQSGSASPLTISKCKIIAGKTQYHDDNDVNDMKDSFEIRGIGAFPSFLDLNQIGIFIASKSDNIIIYEQNIPFNPEDVVKGKFKYSYKIPKGVPGAATSLIIDFIKGTFSVKAKNLDLTGLTCPVQFGLIMNNYDTNGIADESVINGRKLIPTRLMRLFKDTLIVTKTKFKNSTIPSSDSLSIKGDIAVADMNLNTGEPNLSTEDIVITLSDLNDINVQTFTIPAGSFKTSAKGHLYKCTKINPVIAPIPDANTLISAAIDLDKCTFKISITRADLDITSGGTKLNIAFADFDEEDDLF